MIKFIKKNNYIQILLCICLACSMSIYSTYLMIGKISKKLVFLTLILSLIISFIVLFINRTKILKVFDNRIDIIIGLIVGSIIFYEFRSIGEEAIKNINSNYLHISHLHFLIIPIILFLSIIVISYIRKWIIDFYKNMDKIDKIVYFSVSVLSFIILFFIYTKNNSFYTQYDKIYSIDSGWVFKNIFMKSHYYDVRHPILGIITFPLYSVINFTFSSSLKPVLLQFFNVQLLLMIAFELKQLTNNRSTLFLYLLSFPTLLFSIFFEKYVLCVALIVTYIYNNFKRKDDDKLTLSLAGSCMPTSSYIGIMELFKGKTIKDKVLNVVKVLVMVFCLFVCFGRMQTFKYGLEEIKEFSGFRDENLSIVEKINATTSMIEHSFIGLPSKEIDGKYLWISVTDKISILSIIIVLIMIVGLFSIKKKNINTYLSFIFGFLFSFVLFVGLNWAVYEAPLFSVYFSWAIIPLFVLGLDHILKLVHLKKNLYKYVYIVIIVFMLYKNIPIILDIFKFINI